MSSLVNTMIPAEAHYYAVFTALAQPKKLALLLLLQKGPSTAAALAHSVPHLTHAELVRTHLLSLEKVGLVTGHHTSSEIFLLNDAVFADAFDSMTKLQEALAGLNASQDLPELAHRIALIIRRRKLCGELRKRIFAEISRRPASIRQIFGYLGGTASKGTIGAILRSFECAGLAGSQRSLIRYSGLEFYATEFGLKMSGYVDNFVRLENLAELRFKMRIAALMERSFQTNTH